MPIRAWSLDVMEHLSPQALRDVLTEANRVLAARGAVHLHPRAQERLDRRRRAPGQPARPLVRTSGPDRSAAGTTAQVRSPQSARRPRRSASRGGRVRVSARARHVLLARRRRVHGEHPRADGRAAARATGARASPTPAARMRPPPCAPHDARRRPRVGAVAGLYRASARRHGADEARPRRCSAASRSGPFFALLRKTDSAARARPLGRRRAGSSAGPDVRILYVALDQTVPGTLGGSVHVQAVAEGPRRARPRRARGDAARRGRWPGRGRALARDGAATRPAGSCAGSAPAPSRRSRARRRRRRHGALLQLRRRGHARAAARRPAVLEVNAPVIDYPGSTKARIDRALLVEPMRRWRDWHLPARATLFVTTTSADILPAWVDRARVLEVEWGADVRPLPPAAPPGPLPFARDPARIMCVFAGAFRSWHGAVHLSAALARLHAPATTASARSSSATARSARPPNRPRATSPASRSPARCPTPRCPPRSRRPTSASRRSIRPGTRRCGWASTGRRSRSSSTWPSACRSSRPRCRDCAGWSRTSARACSTIRDDPRGLDAALDAAGRRGDAPRAWARPHAPASCATSAGDAHCAALDRAPARAQTRPMSTPLRVLIVTDSFPPRLRRQRLEHVGAGRAACSRAATRSTSCKSTPASTRRHRRRATTTACRVTHSASNAPAMPFVRNYVKNERLWRAARRDYLVTARCAGSRSTSSTRST